VPPPDSELGQWFAARVQPHEPMLRAWLRSRFKSETDLDDVVQETCFRLLRARERGEVASPKAFLFAVARNLALDRFRHREIVPTEPLAESDGLAVLEESRGTPEIVAHNSGAEFTAGDPTYEGYPFITTAQSASNVRVRGMEFEYSQSLSFLPQPFKGLGVRTSYTRNYAQVTLANRSPHLVSAGLNYASGRTNVYANLNWAESRPINAAGTQYQRHRLNLDLGGSVRLAPRLNAFFSVRNVLNEPFIRMEKVGSNPAAAQFFQKFGIIPTIGMKTTF